MKKYFLLCYICLISLPSFGYEAIDTISLFTVNDFHGSFVSSASEPGAAYLASLHKKESSKTARSITLFAGDNYSGGYFSRITKGEPLGDLLKTMDVTASAVGNHEFDWGVDYISSVASKQVPYLSANIFTDSLYRSYPSWVQPYMIKYIELPQGGSLRIGIIGLSTMQTLTTTKSENLKGLYFAPVIQSARAITEKIKDSTDIIILLCHIGSIMDNENPVWMEEDAIGLENIEGIDGIITAHSHKMVSGYINEIPIVQAGSNGKAFGKMQWEIKTDLDSTGVKNRQIRCIDVSVHNVGKDIEPLQSLQAKIEELLHDTVYGFLKPIAKNYQDLYHDRETEGICFTEIGTLVTQSYSDCYSNLMGKSKIPVLGVCNFGGIRTGFYKGDICALDAGNVIPFGGELRAFLIDGKLLKILFNKGINNEKGCMQTHEVKIHKDKSGNIVKIYVLNAKGKYKELKDKDSCVVIAENFMVSGGDNYPVECFVNEVEGFKNIEVSKKNPTDAFILFLQKLKEIKASEIIKPICVDL